MLFIQFNELNLNWKNWKIIVHFCVLLVFLLSVQGLDCDFENSTFCGWENDNTGRAKFNWTIWSGETPSWSTGPRSDVSGSMTLTAYVRLMWMVESQLFMEARLGNLNKRTRLSTRTTFRVSICVRYFRFSSVFPVECPSLLVNNNWDEWAFWELGWFELWKT